MIRFSVRFKEQNKRFDASFEKTDQGFEAGFEAFQVVVADPYMGAYTVIPQVNKQMLMTKNKSMTDDVTVEEIPYSEVSNTSGGTTATIG